jgi:hypothetical protein
MVILEATMYGCTAASHHVLGEAVDFIVTARALLAMLKGFAMGSHGEEEAEYSTFYAHELKSKSKNSLAKGKVVWKKKLLETIDGTFDFNSADAAMKLQKHWDHLTALLRKVLGSAIAAEHDEVCAVLMEAHIAEDYPQVEFTVHLIIIHNASSCSGLLERSNGGLLGEINESLQRLWQ